VAPLRVEAFRSLRAVAPLRAELDALNLASRKPSPFATFEYMEAFVENDEYGTKDEEVLVLAAFEGERLIAYLPLRKHRERVRGIRFGRIGVLVSHDTDRPHVVARREDEARACEAFYRHLLERERGWSLLELAMQDAQSGLRKLPPLAPWRFRAYRFPTMPNATLDLRAYGSLADYFRALGSSHRHDVAKSARRLLAEGRVEFVAGDEPRARAPLLELYLDVERRSWKEEAHAGVRRDPRRVAFYRALARPEQPMPLDVKLVLLDGLPIAGIVDGIFAGDAYGLETCFDRDYEDLSPGHFVVLLSVGRALARGLRGYNLGGNYAYYKAQVGAVVTETEAVQVYRTFSLPWFKRVAGELKRRLRPPPPPPAFNPERRKVERGKKHDRTARPPRDEERALAERTLGELEASHVPFERVGAADIAEQLPFSTKHEAA
jgi:CelD/BcsL family acetyltransferase involved in cellulose biosynthesis